ncbi:MAG: restriction endonuclease subunit S [Gemmiger sp.]|nr:restriction endonuclease subunit S [Gemmiger sp.]
MTGQQLKNSILQMAVQGKLVPQDPNDEPASVLLERIRAEKEKLIKEGKIKKEKNPSVIFRGADNLPYEKIGKNEPVCIADEVPFDVPESWAWVRLKDITIKEIKRGKSPTYANSGNVLVFAQKCNTKAGNIDLSLTKHLDLKVFTKYPDEEYMRDNDIVINSTGNGTLGRIGVFRDSDRIDDCIIVPDSHVTTVRVNAALISDYIYYALTYYQPYLEKNCSGSTNQTELKPAVIANLFIPVPPYAEQRRIVQKLSDVLPLVMVYNDKETALETYNNDFPSQLKKSILQYAVQGKLVPQDPADEPASVLLERIRAEKEQLIKSGKIKRDKHESVIFRRDNSYYERVDGIERCIDDEMPFEIPESWRWTRWGTVATSIQYGYNAPAKQCGRIRMVRISDIHENLVTWTTVPFCDIDELDISTYLLQPNDILFARTGGTVGKSFLVRDVPYEAIYAGYLIRTRYSALLCPQYLKYFMESPLYWQQLKTGTTATAQPNCNGQTLSNMLLPLPPAKEQYRIVEKINRAFAKVK